jgi:hypothetical protein
MARNDIANGNYSMQMIRHHNPLFQTLPDAEHRAPNSFDEAIPMRSEIIRPSRISPSETRATIGVDGLRTSSDKDRSTP